MFGASAASSATTESRPDPPNPSPKLWSVTGCIIVALPELLPRQIFL